MKIKKILLLAFVVILTGCKTQKLECSKTFNDDAYGNRYQVIEAFFKNNSMSRIKMKFEDNLSDNALESREALIDKLSAVLSSFNDSNIKYSNKMTDNGFIFNLDININKLNDNIKKNLYIVNYKNSYDELKLEYENNGYTCK